MAANETARRAARASIEARTLRRVARAREMSAQGVAVDQAAAELGMKYLGFRQLLLREFGSSRWPLATSVRRSVR